MKLPPLPELTDFEMLMVEMQFPLIEGFPCTCTIHLIATGDGEHHSVSVSGDDPALTYGHAIRFVRAKDLAYRRRRTQQAPSSGSQSPDETDAKYSEPDDEIPF